jgi:hypothetical protein
VFSGGVQSTWKTVRDQARNTVLKAARLRMDLLGLAAPNKSMSLNATMELGAALAERDREIAELRARLGDVGNGGPPALTVLLAGQTGN